VASPISKSIQLLASTSKRKSAVLKPLEPRQSLWLSNRRQHNAAEEQQHARDATPSQLAASSNAAARYSKLIAGQLTYAQGFQ